MNFENFLESESDFEIFCNLNSILKLFSFLAGRRPAKTYYYVCTQGYMLQKILGPFARKLGMYEISTYRGFLAENIGTTCKEIVDIWNLSIQRFSSRKYWDHLQGHCGFFKKDQFGCLWFFQAPYMNKVLNEKKSVIPVYRITAPASNPDKFLDV